MSEQSYTKVEYGPMEQWDNHIFKLPDVIRERTGIAEVAGKRFAREDLRLTHMDFSINKLPGGMELPFLHRHTNQEELYLVLGGSGELYVDGEVLPLTAGTAVRVEPSAYRSLRNADLAEPFYYVCFRAQGGEIRPIPEDVPEPTIFDWADV